MDKQQRHAAHRHGYNVLEPLRVPSPLFNRSQNFSKPTVILSLWLITGLEWQQP
jgi:hypothetical protein